MLACLRNPALALAAVLLVAQPLAAQEGAGAPLALPDAPPAVGATAEPGPSLPVMTLDQEGLYRGSAWGQRVQAELERRGREIADENDRLADQFAAEEQELTALRPTLPAEEFRRRADEFDQRVVEIRRERDEALRDLQAQADEGRNAFFRAALPVLADLMAERGVVAVLDRRSIFVAAESIDVTDELIARVDAEIGAGSLTPPVPEDTPEAGQVSPPPPAEVPPGQD
ncbi:periplasmic chaperone for outer membrane proteins Skp [Paracoccus halophilus]|uniref:Periplasmic chaperone for outer membrane proteins Skp n=1 Tax=Paracoccus halophilus TaxID=376733 RepID=A0A099F638_9RHOB|nr:OmpH family outer membrane protein [Paracoccus halophilus]KGJ06200.1 hypothetical protein IT41_03305 [Paracoccus halophilus]SFA45785.1 periplasmic chaperone for outer membrane proteins Skp [Paracoccus halophilus]